MDIVERLTILLSCIDKDDEEMRGAYETVEDAADEIERLRKVNVMQARWLHAAHEDHKLFKDKVRQLLSVESAALKEGE